MTSLKTMKFINYNSILLRMKDWSDLKISDYILSLANLKIERIKRSLHFSSEKCYKFNTSVTFQIRDDIPIYVAPAEICKKDVLVDYETRDESNKKCIIVPSEMNDEIVLKYFFYKIWKEYESEDKDLKSWLYENFVGEVEGLSITSPIEDILDKEFKGELYLLFFKAMWSPDETEAKEEQRSFRFLLKELRRARKTEGDTIEKIGIKKPPPLFYDYFNRTWFDYFYSFKKHFLQLVFIEKEQIASRRFELSSTRQISASPKKKFLRNYYSTEVVLWLNPLLGASDLP